MQITRLSLTTGQIRTRDIPNLTEAEYAKWQHGGEMIQNVLSHLSAEDREFLLTGMTQSEWDKMTGEEEE